MFDANILNYVCVAQLDRALGYGPRCFSLLLKTDLFKKQEEQTFRQGLMWSSLDEVRAVPVNRRGGFYYNKFEIRILKFSKIALGISWLNG